MLRALLPLAVLVTPFLVQAAPATYRDLVEYLVTIMNYAIGTLVVAGLVFYLFGAAQHIFKAKEGNTAQFTQFLLMGIIALFIMVSIWGILALLQNTFFGGGSFSGGAGGTGGGSCDTFGGVGCSIE